MVIQCNLRISRCTVVKETWSKLSDFHNLKGYMGILDASSSIYQVYFAASSIIRAVRRKTAIVSIKFMFGMADLDQ